MGTEETCGKKARAALTAAVAKVRSVSTWVWVALGSVGTLLGAFLLWRSKTQGPDVWEEALAVQKERGKLKKLERKYKFLTKEARGRESEVDLLEADISNAKKKIVQIEKKRDVSHEEAERLFDSLGY